LPIRARICAHRQPLYVALGTIIGPWNGLKKQHRLYDMPFVWTRNQRRPGRNSSRALFAAGLGSAADALEQGLRLGPDDHQARHHLALVYLARGQVAEAERALERIVLATKATEPLHLSAQVDLAVIECSRGEQSGRSRGSIELRGKSQNSRATFYRAVALEHLGCAAEARELLGKLADANTGKYAEQARRSWPPKIRFRISAMVSEPDNVTAA